MLVVLAIAVVGLLRVATAHWREGSVLLGGALLVAAALRAALPPDRAGLLAIRSRVVDILAYSALGLAVVLLAVTITRGSLTVDVARSTRRCRTPSVGSLSSSSGASGGPAWRRSRSRAPSSSSTATR